MPLRCPFLGEAFGVEGSTGGGSAALAASGEIGTPREACCGGDDGGDWRAELGEEELGEEVPAL